MKNANGELAYIITGSVFQCAAMCPCFDMHFDILKPGSEAPVGAVDKIFNGCEELMRPAMKVFREWRKKHPPKQPWD